MDKRTGSGISEREAQAPGVSRDINLTFNG